VPGHCLAMWEFHVKPEFVEEFERAYGSSGSWAVFFRQSPEYLGTELFRDVDRPGRYLTIDRWTSQEALLRFKREHAVEYAALDQQCERLTDTERFLGEFESLTPRVTAPSLRP